MRIKSIDLLHIRSYEKAHIEFSPGINLLIGQNNSGKSTILKAIQRLQNSTSCLMTDDIRKTYSSGKVRILLSDISHQEYAKLYAHTNTLPSPPNDSVSVLIHLRNNLPKNSIPIYQYIVDEANWNIEVSNSDIRATNKIDGTEPVTEFRSFNAMEDDGNFIYLFLAKRKTNNYTGSGGKRSTVSVDDDLRNLPSKIKLLNNQTHDFYDEYQQLCNDILGFPIGSASGATDTTEDKVAILVKHEPIFLESMGDGVANILGMLSIMCTENNKLFLIEELENDIHPSALKKLLDVIINKSSNNQFIISTHSNIVLKYLASAPGTKIFQTKWDNVPLSESSRTKIPTSTVTEVENTFENRLEILEELGYDLLDFDFYKSYVIFEESSAEQIVKEFLIPQFVPNLQNKIKTISASGATKVESSFEAFLRLFVYLNESKVYKNKAWAIADGDDEGIKAIAKLKGKFMHWPDSMFRNFSKPNFEDYYPTQFKEEFNQIKQTQKSKEEKFRLKGELTQKTIQWIRDNKEEAIRDFKESANEVIVFLKEIDATLK